MDGAGGQGSKMFQTAGMAEKAGSKGGASQPHKVRAKFFENFF